jgi:hypothetical protein
MERRLAIAKRSFAEVRSQTEFGNEDFEFRIPLGVIEKSSVIAATWPFRSTSAPVTMPSWIAAFN